MCFITVLVLMMSIIGKVFFLTRWESSIEQSFDVVHIIFLHFYFTLIFVVVVLLQSSTPVLKPLAVKKKMKVPR